MNDYMVRAIAADGTIRAFAAYTRNTVEKPVHFIIQVLWLPPHSAGFLQPVR